jgi:hypothetical protein
LFRGEIRTNVIEYEFANFDHKKDKKVGTPHESNGQRKG